MRLPKERLAFQDIHKHLIVTRSKGAPAFIPTVLTPDIVSNESTDSMLTQETTQKEVSQLNHKPPMRPLLPATQVKLEEYVSEIKQEITKKQTLIGNSPDLKHEKPKEDISDSKAPNILEVYPEYSTTSQLDKLRNTDYAYLDAQNHVYLDYSGSGLAATSQRLATNSRLSKTVCGNPHTISPTSNVSTLAIEEARARILRHFNASPHEYSVIFTANATGAARLVGESYPFSRQNRLVLTADNHNSINGLRQFAGQRHAKTVYIPTYAPELRIDEGVLERVLKTRGPLETLRSLVAGSESGKRGLFAYPAQSNFSGVRHSLSWVELAQKEGYDVLLDVAAYLPTATVDLSAVKPEFMIVSWYKLFGYPTGVGCLIAKKSALNRLSRPWFSGGTIRAVSVAVPWHQMALNESAFEDGTLNFLSIPDVVVGLDWIAGIGMDVIATRVRCLTGWTLQRLRDLKHSDGSPMIKIYGPEGTEDRGSTIAFNFLDAEGKVVDERIVGTESAAAMISLRTGCFCNPGAAESALDLRRRNLISLATKNPDSLDEIIQILGLPSAGAVRVSFGIASTTADVERFFDFASKAYRDRVTTSEGLTPREASC